MNQNRIRLIKDGLSVKGPVVYWMSRDQRIDYNWAFLFAYQEAMQRGFPLTVIFCLVDNFLNTHKRAYFFMLEGLKRVEDTLEKLGFDFSLLIGDPIKRIPEFVNNLRASMFVTDFDPLKIKRKWKDEIARQVQIPFYEVDTHNIVPCWIASSKQEYGAYTIRKKINRQLNKYLDKFPKIKRLKTEKLFNEKTKWESIYERLDIHSGDSLFQSGTEEAKRVLKSFINNKLKSYSTSRNDPNANGLSNLSPYLHFGQISSQYVAMTVLNNSLYSNDVNSFLEELIVRKELSDNFCFYNTDYDNFNGLPQWAKDTLNKHINDKREYLYDEKTLEHAKTHDSLWNAAQKEMLLTGKMHGYMRMYWAKKILQWTESPQEAIRIAIKLNDKYSLDGRDPNGYAGILWSIGGLHDRAYNERAVFGKIRYMSFEGCKRKFDVNRYIETWDKKGVLN